MAITANTLAAWIQGKMAGSQIPISPTPDGGGTGTLPGEEPKTAATETLAALEQSAIDPQNHNPLWAGEAQGEPTPEDAAALTEWLNANEPQIYEALIALVEAMQADTGVDFDEETGEEPLPEEGDEELLEEEPLEEGDEELLEEEPLEEEPLEEEPLPEEEEPLEEEPLPEEGDEELPPEEGDEELPPDGGTHAAIENAQNAEQLLPEYPPFADHVEDAAIAIILALEDAGNPPPFSPEWNTAFGFGLAQARAGDAADFGHEHEMEEEEVGGPAAEPQAPQAPPIPPGGGMG